MKNDQSCETICHEFNKHKHNQKWHQSYSYIELFCMLAFNRSYRYYNFKKKY
jgi:hypothetical protein